MATFPERLKFLRNRKNITQQALADILSITRGAITGYEKLDKQPSFEILIKIAKYFNVTTDYLLGISNDEFEQDSKKYFAEKIDNIFKESGKFEEYGYYESSSYASRLYEITMKAFDYGIYYPVSDAAGKIQWYFLEFYKLIDTANETFDSVDTKGKFDKRKLKSDFLKAHSYKLADEAREAFKELVDYCCELIEEDEVTYRKAGGLIYGKHTKG